MINQHVTSIISALLLICSGSLFAADVPISNCKIQHGNAPRLAASLVTGPVYQYNSPGDTNCLFSDAVLAEEVTKGCSDEYNLNAVWSDQCQNSSSTATGAFMLLNNIATTNSNYVVPNSARFNPINPGKRCYIVDNYSYNRSPDTPYRRLINSRQIYSNRHFRPVMKTGSSYYLVNQVRTRSEKLCYTRFPVFHLGLGKNTGDYVNTYSFLCSGGDEKNKLYDTIEALSLNHDLQREQPFFQNGFSESSGLETSGQFQPILGADRFQKVVIVRSAQELVSRLPATVSTIFILMPPSAQAGVLASLSVDTASGSGESSASLPDAAPENAFNFSQRISSGSGQQLEDFFKGGSASGDAASGNTASGNTASREEEAVLTLSEDKNVSVALVGVYQNHQRTVLKYPGSNAFFMKAAGNVFIETLTLDMPGIQRGVFKETKNRALYVHDTFFEASTVSLPVAAGKGNGDFMLVLSGHTSVQPNKSGDFTLNLINDLTSSGQIVAFDDEAALEHSSCYAVAGSKGENTGLYQHRGFYSNCKEDRLWTLSNQAIGWKAYSSDTCDLGRRYAEAIQIKSSISRVLDKSSSPVTTEFIDTVATIASRPVSSENTEPGTTISTNTNTMTTTLPTSPLTDSSLTVTPTNLLIYLTVGVGMAAQLL